MFRVFLGRTLYLSAHFFSLRRGFFIETKHFCPRRIVDLVALVDDAEGTVTKSSGEGIGFATKSARVCARTIVEISNIG
ncbi:MAG: hypothetical protein ACQJCO_09415 [cyanobacterium endosymbiont of Rhopalodia sterrenbergii]